MAAQLHLRPEKIARMETIGTKLLDFSQPFDVALLDQVVVTMNDPGNSQRDVANRIMVALQEHQESWNKVCDILEQSNNPATKFFGLQVLMTSFIIYLFITSYSDFGRCGKISMENSPS